MELYFPLGTQLETDCNRFRGRYVRRVNSTQERPVKKFDLALAEANRLYSVTPTDGERRALADLTARFPARVAVDLLFGPTAVAYDAPGGLRDVLRFA